MIRVLHLDTGRIFRGGQEQVYLHLKHMGRFEIEQYLACTKGSGLNHRARSFVSEYWPLTSSNLGRLLDCRKLAAFIREKQIQIIHAHDSHAHSLAVLLKLANAEAKVIVTRRSSGRITFGSRTKYTGHGIMFVAISAHIRDNLLEGGVKPERISLIPSMIEIPELKAPDTDDNTSQLVSIGAFDRKKGTVDILKALKILRDTGKFSGGSLILVGDGPERPQIDKFIRSNHLSDIVTLTGWVDDITPFMKAEKIYLAPSYSEGLGVSLLKAMGAGMAVAASDIPPHQELVENNRTGLLFRAGDPSDLAEKLGNLLDSPELVGQLSRSARKFALKFDASLTSERIYRLYCEVCQPR